MTNIMEKTKLEFYSTQAMRLFDESRRVIEESGIDRSEELVKKVPDSMFGPAGKKLSVVFAGQYSAGKSTLIRILTGNDDIKVGGGITTQEAASYDWNGIQVVDTPGISTEHIKEHDIEAKEAISKADLLVYMLTQKGFDDFLANDFQEIAIDMGKIHEMMLVVNKMKNTESGNTPEQQKITFEHNIYPACQPQTAESLYAAFLDLQSYERAQMPKYEKYRDQLLMDSGMDVFFKNFDRFMKDKGHVGALTTQLYTLHRILSDALDGFKTDDSVEEATIHLLNKKNRLVNEAILDIKDWYSSHFNTYVAKIINLGESAINVAEKDGFEMLNAAFQQKQNELPAIYSDFESKLTQYIDGRMAQLENEIGDVFTDSFANNLKDRIKRLRDETQKKAFAAGTDDIKMKDYLDNLSKGVDEGVKKFAASKDRIHDYILKKGHAKGVKFKPHQVNKETGKVIEKVGKLGKYAKVGLVLVGVGWELFNEYKDYKNAQAIKEMKRTIQSFFDDEAKECDDRYLTAVDDFVRANLSPIAGECTERISRIRKAMHTAESAKTKIYSLMEQTNDLIERIHAS